jgi:PAS domain S-box-containing protein
MSSTPEQHVRASALLGRTRSLHGRVAEVRRIWEAFHRAQRGGLAVVLVEGPAGIGKTRLLESLAGPMRIEGARFARSCWLRGRAAPFEGLLGALDEVVQDLCGLPEAELVALERRLEQEAGGGLGLLTGLLPGLELITGPRPPPPPMAPQEAQQRFVLMLHRAVRCFAVSSNPLVLFLDDLQWAEPSSLDLLRGLVETFDGPGLLLVFGLRTGGEGPALGAEDLVARLVPPSVDFVRLAVGPLDEAELGTMLGSLLHREPKQVAELGDLVAQRTGGNPWAVHRLLVRLQAFGALRLEDDRWHWELDRIVAALDSPVAAPACAEPLATLPGGTRDLLELAACLGGALDAELLGLAGNLGLEELEDLLEPALRAGLLLDPRGDSVGGRGAPPRWRFVEQRVQQDIYEALEDKRRHRLHRRITRRLNRAWRARGQVKVLLAVTDQLQRLDPAGDNANARAARAELFLEAGKHAIMAARWSRAHRHLEAALAVMPPSFGPAWELELRRLLAQALQALGRFDQADEQLVLVASLAQLPGQCVALAVQRTGMLVHAARYQDAVEEGLRGLEGLGLDLPGPDRVEAWRGLLGQEIARQEVLLAGREPRSLVSSLPMDDPGAAHELALLAALAPPAYVVPTLMPWVYTRMANLCLEHGFGDQAPLAFAYQGLLCCAGGQVRRGVAFADLALALEEQLPDRRLYGPVMHLYVNFIAHWGGLIDDSLERSLRAMNVAAQHGQFDYAGWLAMNAALNLLYVGAPLDGALERCVGLLRNTRSILRYDDAATVIAAVVRVMATTSGRGDLLAELDLAELSLDDLAGRLEHYRVARAHVYLVGLMQAVQVQDWATARRCADALEPDMGEAAGLGGLVERALYEVVLICQEQRDMDASQRSAAMARAAGHLEDLERWAAGNPMGYGPRRDLVAAEIMAMRGDAAAGPRYMQALEGAAALPNHALEALAARRASRYHEAQQRPRMARLFVDAARSAFGRWGGRSDLLPTVLEGDAGAGGGDPAARLEQARHRASSQRGAVDPRRQASRLTELVRGHADAQRAAFFLERDHGLVHLASVDGTGRRDLELRPVADGEPWPLERLQAAWQGQCTVRGTTSAVENGPWVVLNLDQDGQTSGLLFLERRARQPVFSAAEEASLTALGGLALVALDDLRHYRELARLSEALERSSSKLATHSQSLEMEVQRWAGDLEALAEEHRSTLGALLDGVVRVDLQGTILYANPAAARITGYDAGELVGAHGSELLEARDQSGLSLSVQQLPVGGGKGSDAPFNARLRRKDGGRVSVEFRWSPVFRSDGTMEGGVIAIRDTTQRQQLEAQLRHAQKMEAMGRFAGGMAHDLNNLLTPILGNLERIAQDTEGPRQLRRLQAAERAAERASVLVKQVLAFSRRAEVFKRPTDLLPIVDEVCTFLRRSMDRAIELRWDPPGGEHWFQGDAGLVQQVLLNLGLNARDAIEQARQRGLRHTPAITVRLERLAADPRRGGLGSLELAIQDNGIGMDEATKARIFEPFFTTKPADRGTGLGLAVVYGIVEQHGGSVRVDSQPGRGSTFTFTLPACAPGPRTSPEPERAAPVHGGERLVLVVDDEAPVRELARDVLEDAGYRVEEAANGEAALALHGELGAEIALVLLDLSMPGISGPETLRRLLARDPSMRVVLWSGYSAQDDLPASVGAEASGFLEKPFQIGELLGIVERTLA